MSAVALARCLALVVLVAPSALAQTSPPVRAQLAAFEEALDSAIRGLGPAAGWQTLGSPERTRGYFIEDYGAMFVVPPRVLPRGQRRLVWSAEATPDIEGSLERIEEGLHRIESAEVRAALAQTLRALRQDAQLVTPAPGPAAAGPAEEQLRERLAAARAEELHARRSAQEAAQRARAHRAGAGDSRETDELEQAALEAEVRRQRWAREVRLRGAELRGLEAEVDAFRLEAEQARRDAEHRLREVSHEVHVRFGSGQGDDPVALAGAPVPWAFWFETRSVEEPGNVDERVGAVREAVTRVLETQGARMEGLRPDDIVAVAVDFVPLSAATGTGQSERSLVLRVRHRELRAHLTGELDADALRQRIQVSDY